MIKRNGYRLYKKLEDLPLAATAAHFLYHRVFAYLRPDGRPCRYRPSGRSAVRRPPQPMRLADLKIAFVCDEMTYCDFAPECRAFFVTPHNWLEVFEKERPDLFFCEAAWSGIDAFPNSWRGKIYRSDRIRFENRRDLLNILAYCKEHGIPTAFWNKEDPTFFGNQRYDFVDTALRFDYIFTTAQECVPEYRRLGHSQVEVLLFGFSPRLFHPAAAPGSSKRAVFAGSWYSDQPQRCQDMQRVFDMVLSAGLELVIYDRHSSSANPLHQFPARYRPYVRPAVPFEQLGRVLGEARFAININTVRDSGTMFARRVFELMACGLVIISNESKALRAMFGRRIWFVDEPFDLSRADEICRENLEEVYRLHTCRQRLCQVAGQMGFSIIFEQEKNAPLPEKSSTSERNAK